MESSHSIGSSPASTPQSKSDDTSDASAQKPSNDTYRQSYHLTPPTRPILPMTESRLPNESAHFKRGGACTPTSIPKLNTRDAISKNTQRMQGFDLEMDHKGTPTDSPRDVPIFEPDGAISQNPDLMQGFVGAYHDDETVGHPSVHTPCPTALLPLDFVLKFPIVRKQFGAVIGKRGIVLTGDSKECAKLVASLASKKFWINDACRVFCALKPAARQHIVKSPLFTQIAHDFAPCLASPLFVDTVRRMTTRALRAPVNMEVLLALLDKSPPWILPDLLQVLAKQKHAETLQDVFSNHHDACEVAANAIINVPVTAGISADILALLDLLPPKFVSAILQAMPETRHQLVRERLDAPVPPIIRKPFAPSEEEKHNLQKAIKRALLKCNSKSANFREQFEKVELMLSKFCVDNEEAKSYLFHLALDILHDPSVQVTFDTIQMCVELLAEKNPKLFAYVCRISADYEVKKNFNACPGVQALHHNLLGASQRLKMVRTIIFQISIKLHRWPADGGALIPSQYQHFCYDLGLKAHHLTVMLMNATHEGQWKLQALVLLLTFHEGMQETQNVNNQRQRAVEVFCRLAATSRSLYVIHIELRALKPVATEVLRLLESCDLNLAQFCACFLEAPIDNACLRLLGSVIETAYESHESERFGEAIIFELCKLKSVAKEMLIDIGMASPSLVKWLAFGGSAERILKTLSMQWRSFSAGSKQLKALHFMTAVYVAATTDADLASSAAVGIGALRAFIITQLDDLDPKDKEGMRRRLE